jgi:cytochrome c oxidase assembly protein subunit 15
MVEFVNRVFTGFVSLAVIATVLGSLLRSPRRRDLTLWSLGLVAGVIGQIILGGIVVLVELHPVAVIGHFLLSMVLLWNATVLCHRASLPDNRRVVRRPVATRALVWIALAATALVTGTVVTASGPHAGDEVAKRFDFALPEVARIHGITVAAFIVMTIALIINRETPGSARSRLRVVLGLSLAQALVGYVQYFTGVPELLVGIHVLGASLVWIFCVRVIVVFHADEVIDLSEGQQNASQGRQLVH